MPIKTASEFDFSCGDDLLMGKWNQFFLESIMATQSENQGSQQGCHNGTNMISGQQVDPDCFIISK